MSLKKVDYIDQETIIEAENLNDIQDAIIVLEETGPDAIVNTASGEAIVISDASGKKLAGLNIYGKSTQAGTPTPDAPVDIVSVGEDGDVGIYVGEDRFVLMLPNGLHGIPVKDKSIATYTDSKGQMWCADEIDLARGVQVQRVAKIELTGEEAWGNTSEHEYRANFGNVPYAIFDGVVCTHYKQAENGIRNVHGTIIRGISGYQIFICDNTFNNDVTAFTSALADKYKNGNPVTVYCRMTSTIETPLTAEQIAAYKALHTNKPNTTITNGENAYMTVKYIADPKSYIDNKVASAILAATVE